MLEEAEAQARDLRAKLDAPAKAELQALKILPGMVRERLADLERVLAHDVTRAREALRDIVGDIVLRPTDAQGPRGRAPGKPSGSARFGRTDPDVGNVGSGGRILQLPRQQVALA